MLFLRRTRRCAFVVTVRDIECDVVHYKFSEFISYLFSVWVVC